MTSGLIVLIGQGSIFTYVRIKLRLNYECVKEVIARWKRDYPTLDQENVRNRSGNSFDEARLSLNCKSTI
jgi:hypothetical protein